MITTSTGLDCLPAAATFSKSPLFWSRDPAFQPQQLRGGLGAYVFGTDGRRYLDWVSGLGAIILGHGHGGFCQRINGQLWNGTAFSLPHPLEQQVAEKLCYLLGRHVPGWSPDGLAVRFGLSGSDACSMAVRLARAIKEYRPGRILIYGYHGWGGEFIGATPPAWGVPTPLDEKWTSVFQYGDLYDLAYWLSHGNGVSAVIIEQPPQDPPAGYWQGVRQLCDKSGALLILDEVVTGLRYGLGGAAEHFGIEPDIVCIGKAFGNGIPISAMVFRKDWASWFSRNDPVFVSSTGFGNPVGLAAADAVLDIWDQSCVDHLWDIGGALMGGLEIIGYNVIGHGPRSLVQFASKAERGYFCKAMADLGYLVNRPNFVTLSHNVEDATRTITAAGHVKSEMDDLGPDGVAAVMAGKEPMQLFEGR